jgi:hypothetical protein
MIVNGIDGPQWVPNDENDPPTLTAVVLAALILIGLIVLLLAPPAKAAQVDGPEGGVTIAAPLHATDQEADEGYFNVGHGRAGFAIIPQPGTDLHSFLRSKVGKRVRITISTIPE